MCTVSHILHLWCLKGRQTSAELTYFSHSSIFHRQPSSTRTKSHSGLRSFQVCTHSVSFSLWEGLWCHQDVVSYWITYSKYENILFETSYWGWFVFDLCLSKMISRYPVLPVPVKNPWKFANPTPRTGIISVHTHMKRVASRGLRETLESLPQQSLDELSINGNILDVA